MTARRHTRMVPAALAAASTLLVLGAPTALAKNINLSKGVGTPIPDAVAGPPPALIPNPGVVASTITVGKTGKAKQVRDVNVTVQTTGTAGTTPAADLVGRLTSPSGNQSLLFFDLEGVFGAPNLSIGPLTLDDEARLNIGDFAPRNPNYLYAPWAGAATPVGTPLAGLDITAARGAWTLTLRDTDVGETSTFVSWALNVTTGKPYKTK